MSLSDSARSQLALAVDLRDAAVLLVTDSARAAEDFLISLTESGLKMLLAESGPAAKQKLMREPVELVLVDLNRTDMDSFELCRQLKVPPQTRLIPVLFLSNRSDMDAKIRAFRVGASDYIDSSVDCLSPAGNDDTVNPAASRPLRLWSRQSRPVASMKDLKGPETPPR